MKIYLSITLFLVLFLACNSQAVKSSNTNNSKSDTILKTSYDSISPVKTLIGLNQNWSYLPELTPSLLSKIAQLKPQILRYPGGTVSHSWDWKNGVITTRKPNVKHPITDIKKLADATQAKFVFVLDIVNKSLEDQIEMLQSIQTVGIPIEYIELGNELYAKEDNYATVFPTGTDYAQKVRIWYQALKTKFANAHIAALLFGRIVNENDTRQYLWNKQVVNHTLDFIDAYTYHIYINEKSDFLTTKNNFNQVVEAANTGTKPLWITEYGNKHASNEDNYLDELAQLADFVESFPNATIAMSHQIVGSEKNKLTQDGSMFTPEGDLFLERVNKK